MASRARIDWGGDKLLGKVFEAARAAINETTAEAAADAETSHWWKNRTGNLEENIQADEAKIELDRVVGRFGTTYSGKKGGGRSGFYGLFLEYRTPFLRPAADRHFPTLADKIRRRLG